MKKLLIGAALVSATAASAEVSVKHYGFVKAAYTMSDSTHGAGARNSVANTDEVGHKPFFAQDEDNASDYNEEQKGFLTTTQSRWGMLAKNGSKTSGRIEFDLDGGSTNGIGSLSTARIRQANIVYKPTENDTIEIGKKWSSFMGVLPFTRGFTRVYFWAGNSGFFTNGIDWTHKFGNLDLILDLSNVDATDTGYVSSPVATVVLNYKMENHTFGIAHTTANLESKKLDKVNNKDSKASGTKAYWAGRFGNTWINAEYSMGANLGSIQTGALGEAVATTDDEIKTTAYFISAKYQLKTWSVFGGYGMDAMNDEEDAGDNQVSKNSIMTLGADYVLDEGLTVIAEYNAFTTSYYRAADDKSEDSNGSFVEVGLVYKF